MSLLEFKVGTTVETVDLDRLIAVKGDTVRLNAALSDPDNGWQPKFVYAQLRTVHNAGGELSMGDPMAIGRLYSQVANK